MYGEVLKKRSAFEQRKPFAPDVSAAVRRACADDWIWSAMRMNGSRFSREDVCRLLDGETVLTATIGEWQTVLRYDEAIKKAYDACEMQTDIDVRFFGSVYRMLTGEEPAYRRSHPVLFTFGISPVMPDEISRGLAAIVRRIDELEAEAAADPQGPVNEFVVAAVICAETVRVYPFEAGSEFVSLFMAYYYLLRHGFVPFALSCSETEFNTGISDLLLKNDASLLRGIFERSAYNEYEKLLMATE